MSALLFPREEYAARLAATQAEMARRDLASLIVTDPSNMNWLTGYDAWSFYVHQAAIVPAAGEPLLFLRPMDAPSAAATAWIGADRVFGYPDSEVQNPDRHPCETLAERLADLGLGAGAVGVEMDNYYFSAACLEALRRRLPAARIEDAAGLVNWRRAVKSPAELALIRKAGLVTAEMHRAARETLREGLPKHELVAEVARAGIRGAPGAWGDYPAIAPIVPSGAEAAAAHFTWNDRPLARGETTYLEISGCHRRYHCPASRTCAVGEPAADVRRGEAAVLRALDDALAAAKPGALCEDVAREVYASFARAGFRKESRTGYSVGLSYPPDWGERTMSLRPGDRTALAEDMVFHLMPGLWTADWGVAITETFVVTPAGGRRLAAIPPEIFVAP